MPGPDGISSLAYKVRGDLAIDTLFDVFSILASDNALEELTNAYRGMSEEHMHEFNKSIMCLLPKKASGHDETHGTYFHPGDTRPLSISNTDNRLLASAARIAWEPILERWISKVSAIAMAVSHSVASCATELAALRALCINSGSVGQDFSTSHGKISNSQPTSNICFHSASRVSTSKLIVFPSADCKALDGV